MASKQEIAKAKSIAEKFNSGARVFNPGGYTAEVDVIDDDDYSIEVRNADGDLEETFSSVAEFCNWIEDEESGYVD